MHHQNIADAVVVRVPDATWGQRIGAVIVPRPAAHPDPRELQAHGRASRTPDRITVLPEQPRTPVGEIVRRDLTARLVHDREAHSTGMKTPADSS
ncbi:hypothetical protein MKW14_28180 [Streptomyces sp. CME 23]|nr:hypothetical protein [Streptomyces sp. CME 23]MCH5675644.1 hypothetical protein [Streptomyces sp. CME 23]